MDTDFVGTAVLVLGLGTSGQAASRILAERGAKVLAYDEHRIIGAELIRTGLESSGVEVQFEGDVSDFMAIADLVVVSPGFPGHHGLVADARRRGVPVWSEIELAANLPSDGRRLIAVTGTNGKTTTCHMLGAIFEAAGVDFVLAGNIGQPLSTAFAKDQSSLAVAEISSFQLENTFSLRPHIAVFLNATEDHLDWHQGYEEYLAAKSRIFMNQEATDWVVVNADDPTVMLLASHALGSAIPFSKGPLDAGVFLTGKDIMLRPPGGCDEIKVMDRAKLKLPGLHSAENAMAAIAAAWASGVAVSTIERALAGFNGLPHRLEWVAHKDGVDFFNDSKATNPGAAQRALESFEDPVIIILGGRNKGNTFEALSEVVKKRAKAAVVFGEAGPAIEKALKGKIAVLREPLLEDAVARARDVAAPGDTVLLSPACASYDLFTSYEQRGEAFREAVLALR